MSSQIIKCRPKRTIQEAVYFNGNNKDEVINFCNSIMDKCHWDTVIQRLLLKDRLCFTPINPTDYVLKDVDGNPYVCNTYTFKTNYEVIDES